MKVDFFSDSVDFGMSVLYKVQYSRINFLWGSKLENFLCKHCHHLPNDEIAKLLETDLSRGLSGFEAKDRLKTFGANTITVGKKKSPIIKFMMQFHNPLIYILIMSGTITAVLNEPVDSSVIFLVVILNAIVSFIQESKAEKAIESLSKAVQTESTVIRDGKKIRISSAEITVGDVIFVQSGDKIPADLRLFSVSELRINESVLTGESLASEKTADVLKEDTPLADRKNMAYAGTFVSNGQGMGIAVATGNKTETGRISHLISEATSIETPLTKKIAKFSNVALVLIGLLAAITFVLGVLNKEPIVYMIKAAVALAVAAIPEGLPAVVTITLAIGVFRMSKRGAIIRKLPAVETLGSATVICSDKTGTITENQMTVSEVYAGEKSYDVSGGGYNPAGEISFEGEKADIANDFALHQTLLAGSLCNDSAIAFADNVYSVQGDPTEGALIVCAAKAGYKQSELSGNYPRLDVVPFESHRQYMATLHLDKSKSEKIIYIKGSVERILERCDRALSSDGGAVELDKDAVIAKMNSMAGKGLRVLGFAMKKATAEGNVFINRDLPGGFVFIGLQAMLDPPRKEVIEAISSCKQAGIGVKMITGDHAVTAKNIGKMIGLISTDDKGIFSDAITGSTLEKMGDEELIEAADKANVFARVAPEQKLRLVEALQARGHVVAMTGDGVNDAPALKQADIGVAMGITGTDVAREAADMILTDDNFATIKAAVEEGRSIFDNLVKFIIWTLPTNMGQGLIILAAVAFATVLPILPVQILWLNMTTALFLGLMLAFEPKEPDIMFRKPRTPQAPIITKSALFRILLVGVIMVSGGFWLFTHHKNINQSGHLPIVEAEARTIAVNVFVMIQILYLFNCRSLTRSIFSIGIFSNMYLIYGILMMLAAQIAFTYFPFMNKVFHSAPIDFKDWGKILLIGVLSFIIVGIEKRIVRMLERKSDEK